MITNYRSRHFTFVKQILLVDTSRTASRAVLRRIRKYNNVGAETNIEKQGLPSCTVMQHQLDIKWGGEWSFRKPWISQTFWISQVLESHFF